MFGETQYHSYCLDGWQWEYWVWIGFKFWVWWLHCRGSFKTVSSLCRGILRGYICSRGNNFWCSGEKKKKLTSNLASSFPIFDPSYPKTHLFSPIMRITPPPPHFLGWEGRGIINQENAYPLGNPFISRKLLANCLCYTLLNELMIV